MVLADQPVGLAIMAKAPRAGAVKTRLCPPLRRRRRPSWPDASSWTRWSGRRAWSASGRCWRTRRWRHGASSRASRRDSRCWPSEGEDLGARQARLISEVLSLGHQAALVIGTDSPTLPRECLDEAVSLVMAPDVDLVLGPTDDGGYYLIGLRAPCPALFEGMPWSTSAVLSRTLDRAQRLGLRVACLPAWFDVDTKADLERLAAELAVTPGLLPRHTRDFLARRISPGSAGVKPADHASHATHGRGAVASRGD